MAKYLNDLKKVLSEKYDYSVKERSDVSKLIFSEIGKAFNEQYKGTEKDKFDAYQRYIRSNNNLENFLIELLPDEILSKRFKKQQPKKEPKKQQPKKEPKKEPKKQEPKQNDNKNIDNMTVTELKKLIKTYKGENCPAYSKLRKDELKLLVKKLKL